MFLAPQSTDPVDAMRLAEQAPVKAVGISTALIVVDFFRHRQAQ